MHTCNLTKEGKQGNAVKHNSNIIESPEIELVVFENLGVCQYH